MVLKVWPQNRSVNFLLRLHSLSLKAKKVFHLPGLDLFMSVFRSVHSFTHFTLLSDVCGDSGCFQFSSSFGVFLVQAVHLYIV